MGDEGRENNGSEMREKDGGEVYFIYRSINHFDFLDILEANGLAFLHIGFSALVRLTIERPSKYAGGPLQFLN